MFKSKLQLLPWVSSFLSCVFESLVLVTRKSPKIPKRFWLSDHKARHALRIDRVPEMGFLFLGDKCSTD